MGGRFILPTDLNKSENSQCRYNIHLDTLLRWCLPNREGRTNSVTEPMKFGESARLHPLHALLCASFDEVNNSKLIAKLKPFGITGKLLGWLE